MIWLNLLSIIAASEQVGIAPELLYSLCHTETKVRNIINKHDGKSPSYGICQVKLRTAKQFFPEATAGWLMVPYNNAKVAATYLKYQGIRFKSVLRGISAYNAGKPIKSNKKYVKNVLKMLGGFNEIAGDHLLVYR